MSGALGFIGGLAKGYSQGKQYKDWNDRQNQTMDIKQAGEDRAQSKYDLQMALRRNEELRPDLRPDLWEDPNKQPGGPMSPAGIPAGAVPMNDAPTPQSVEAPPGEAPPGEAPPGEAPQWAASQWADAQPGMGYEQPQGQMALRGAAPTQGPIQTQATVAPQNVATPGWAKAAEGGPVGVPTQALPAVPDDGMGPSQAPTPQEAGPPAPAKPVPYRERYQVWKKQADIDAMMAGGLEGYSKFQDMENATSRRMIMGYGFQAIRALDEGNVGEALRAGNTALEATPFDTGLKFIANNGKLMMVGKDGKPGEPLSADHLRAFVEDQMKTPESYLNWKKQTETERSNWKEQTETERSNLKTEAQKDTALGIQDRGTAVQEGYLNIAEEKVPGEMAKTGAEIYALTQRAFNADKTKGLTENTVKAINNDIPTLIQNAKIDTGSEWLGAMARNPTVSGIMQSGAIDIAKMNLLGEGNYADAIGLSAFAMSPMANIAPPTDANLGRVGVEGEGDDAYAYAVWNGKKLKVPPQVYSALMAQYQRLISTGSGALPDDQPTQ